MNDDDDEGYHRQVTPHVVRLDLGVIPSPSGSAELLLTDERSCRLVFATEQPHRVAMATFAGYAQALFGYPNDEALPGHPLYHPDWEYGCYEVQGSPWPGRLAAQNRVRFPDQTSSRWGQLRHFLVVCHEDLVEVLADDVSVELFDTSFEEVAMHALRLNLGSL
ncbi:hypothetical protein AB0B86_12945 [Micromonospora sp. NPDC049047]|uniref:hypothetical protein n=1 Tax=Micromonospora sp. NPDC049047 TaxID=3155645 RepID=UPI0033EF6BCB